LKVDTTRKWQILYEEVEESKEMKKSDYKVDPGSINVDHRKQDTRRDAWDRDYMGGHYIKPEPTSTKQISNAAPVLVFAFFFIAILIMVGNK